jgi:HrpA-like RNA helicase
MDHQMKIYEEDSIGVNGERRSRKVIVPTNVAETSVATPPIVSAVDSGFVRLFDPVTEMLVIQKQVKYLRNVQAESVQVNVTEYIRPSIQ